MLKLMVIYITVNKALIPTQQIEKESTMVHNTSLKYRLSFTVFFCRYYNFLKSLSLLYNFPPICPDMQINSKYWKILINNELLL